MDFDHKSINGVLWQAKVLLQPPKSTRFDVAPSIYNIFSDFLLSICSYNTTLDVWIYGVEKFALIP